ncbi:hypothetical protein FDECE_13729 [Fusarium decemcellulare]|nr:hypothetical protein FDECE_13729 [Fusarium decemcellulare]
MVGVPGRSQSCITCLSRRKGCDRQKPACTQCLEAGLTCGGYARTRTFVNRTPAEGFASASYRTSTSPAAGSATPAEDVTLAQSLAQTAYNSKYIDLFWSEYLPGGKTFTANAARFCNGAWVTVAMDLYPTDRSLQLAMQCVTLRGLGTHNRDQSLIEQGLEAYTKCLQEFNSALRDPKRLRQDSLLCTARLLAMFEMHYGSDDRNRQGQYNNWAAHAKGQLAILVARQPKDFRSGQAHQLFVDYRYILVIAALGQRRRFALSNKGWKTIPWKTHRKTPHDKLIDVLGDLAGVFEDIDNLRSIEEGQKAAARESIARSCWGLDKQLQNWVNEVGPLKDFRQTGEDGPRDPEDFALSNLTILYWATCILVYTHLLAFTHPGTDIPPRVNISPYALNLASALPFFFKPSAGIMGPKLAAFPLGSVLQVLSGTEDRLSNHRKLLGEFFKAQDESRGVAKFLMSLQRGSGRNGMAEQDGCNGVESRAKTWVNLGEAR